MKAFVKTIIALSLTGFSLAILGSFSGWLSVAFVMIFGADIIHIVVADYRRIQRQQSARRLPSSGAQTFPGFNFQP